jgi:hypothetical protein
VICDTGSSNPGVEIEIQAVSVDPLNSFRTLTNFWTLVPTTTSFMNYKFARSTAQIKADSRPVDWKRLKHVSITISTPAAGTLYLSLSIALSFIPTYL